MSCLLPLNHATSHKKMTWWAKNSLTGQRVYSSQLRLNSAVHLIRSSGTAATKVHADVTEETFNGLATRHRLSTILAGVRKFRIDLVEKLHRENTTFLRFWIGLPTAAGSIKARSKALNWLYTTAGVISFTAAMQL